MNKKAQAIEKIVGLTIGLIIIVILIFLAYQYILQPGEKIGAFANCEKQDGTCIETSDKCEAPKKVTLGLGCKAPARFCCLQQT